MPRPVDADTARYLQRVRELPALEREQEAEFARRFIERGDRPAGDRVIAANLRHVVPIALRYRRLGVPVDELVAQGNLGLVAALRRYDPARGVRFGTYASHWIRAEILALVLRQRSLVSGGRGPLAAKYVFRLRREHSRLQAQLGDDPEVLRILAERFRKAPEQVADILKRVETRDTSLDAAIAGEGGTRPLVDRLRDDVAPALDDTVAREYRRGELSAAVERAIAALSARERYIVEHRLLADDESRLSLSEIGRRFGISRERARQIEHALRGKLRARLAAIARQLDAAPAA